MGPRATSIIPPPPRILLTPLALAALLLCSSVAAQGYSQTFDPANNPSDTTNKLLTIASTANSFGPANNSESGDLQDRLDARHSDNTLTIQNGTIAGSVYGAYTKKVNTPTSNNTVTINGGTVNGATLGGHSWSEATDNKIIVNNGTPRGIQGGVAEHGKANNNSVTINGGTVEHGITGDRGVFEANNNHIIINGGTVDGRLTGGFSYGGNAHYNTIEVRGGVVTGYIMGGYNFSSGGNPSSASMSRSSNNNLILISGGEVRGDIIGGASIQRKAINNTLIITGSPTFNAFGTRLIGGNSDILGADVRSGNKLEIRTKGIAVKNIKNFERINFYLPSDIAANNTVLYLTDTAGADITGTQIGVALPAGTPLAHGDRVALIHTTDGPLVSDAGNL